MKVLKYIIVLEIDVAIFLLACKALKCRITTELRRYFNPLKTKRRLLYLKTKFVPRSKHFISVIKTNQFML